LDYTDSHCHLYDTRGVPVEEVISAARAAGITTMVNVGCDAVTTEQAIALAATHDDIFATAGLHPHEARHGVDTILPYLDDPNVIAIGECGLDYFYDHSPRPEQRRAFAEQIQLARQRSLPLVIHTRDAWEETFDILDAEGTAFLSFSGIVTFKAATDLHDAARLCPIERMLAETDSPYLAPAPHRGKPNRPAYVTHVVQALADLRGAPLEEVRAATVANACLAFPGIRP